MDQSMIDVTELSSINEGDDVTIIRSDNNNQITASDIAKASGMIQMKYYAALVKGYIKVRLKISCKLL